jgi:hypothetical protein
MAMLKKGEPWEIYPNFRDVVGLLKKQIIKRLVNNFSCPRIETTR